MREHNWIRHPKVDLSSCGACGRHWWHDQPKPTDPCTGERVVTGASS